MPRFMIYGANGYTGRLTAIEAKKRGLKPVLAGRSRDTIEPLARELGFEFLVFGLNDRDVIARNLAGVDAVLNCAGPFSATAHRMLAGCAASNTHYLDITGEIGVFEYVHNRNDEWVAAGIVAMPGVGFDVVPSDCLAAMLKRDLPDATHLKLAFRSNRGKLSPGTTRTMVEGLAEAGKIRRDGRIVAVPSDYKIEEIPFTEGETGTAVTIPWGDVSTAYHSTGIPNIEVFMGASPDRIRKMNLKPWMRAVAGLGPVQALAKWWIGKKIKGPTDEERASDNMYLYGEVTNAAGQRAARRMVTPEGYTLTADASLESVRRLLASEPKPGARTPSAEFGPDFITELNGVTCSKA